MACVLIFGIFSSLINSNSTLHSLHSITIKNTEIFKNSFLYNIL